MFRVTGYMKEILEMVFVMAKEKKNGRKNIERTGVQNLNVTTLMA